jgi:nuclear cap-binding protein subunit 1
MSKLTNIADEDDHYERRERDDRRGPQRRRRDDGPPRRRFEEAPLAKLRRLLLNIASSARLPQEEVIEIAQDFGENYDDEYLRNAIFDIAILLYVVPGL